MFSARNWKVVCANRWKLFIIWGIWNLQSIIKLLNALLSSCSSVIWTTPCGNSCLDHRRWTACLTYSLLKFSAFFFSCYPFLLCTLPFFKPPQAGVKMGRDSPQRSSGSAICRNRALLGLALYRDLSLSGSAYSQVRIMAVVGAFGSANLGGGLGGSATWETQVMSASLLLWNFAFNTISSKV